MKNLATKNKIQISLKTLTESKKEMYVLRQNIRNYLTENKISMRQFARDTKISSGYLGDVLLGKKMFGPTAIDRINNWFNNN